jgi:hypothetical protein
MKSGSLNLLEPSGPHRACYGTPKYNLNVFRKGEISHHEKNTQYHIITIFYIFLPSSMNRYSMGNWGFTSGKASYFVYGITFTGGTPLRHCATSRKVAGSIPDSVIGIFHYGPGVDSASPRNKYQAYILGNKGCRCVGLTTLPPSCADCLEIWEPEPPGTLRACPGFTVTFIPPLVLTQPSTQCGDVL